MKIRLKGHLVSEKTRRKISLAHKGKKLSKETKQKISNFLKGKPILKARGQNSPHWKGGITSLNKYIRKNLESKEWRKIVFERDNYTCQECFIRGGELHPHHKKSFSQILNEFLQTYSQFSPLEDKETLVRLAITYQPFWDVDNGITLCKECHKKIHKGIKQWGNYQIGVVENL